MFESIDAKTSFYFLSFCSMSELQYLMLFHNLPIQHTDVQGSKSSTSCVAKNRYMFVDYREMRRN